MPRVEPGRHVGFITKVDVSGDGRFALTVSEDKTARLWDLENRRLHDTIRVPIAAGHEGRLYVGAMRPDGLQAAIGGYTGMVGDCGAIIYIQDFVADRLLSIRDLPCAGIDNLQYSKDGRLLAVAFAESQGIMVFDMTAPRLVVHIREGNDRVYGMDFGPDDSLVVSSIDGRIARYAGPEFDVQAEISLARYGEPMHVRFSPDGTRLAIGFRSTPFASVLEAASLRELQLLDASGVPELVGLIAAEWSADGTRVYAGGRSEGNVETPFLRWTLGRSGGPDTLFLAPKRIGDIHRLADGRLVYVTGSPTVGLVDADGQHEWVVDAVTADIRSAEPAAFRLSADGRLVEFPFDRENRRTGRFDVFNPDPAAPLAVIQDAPETLYPADTGGASWDIRLDSEAMVASVNGNSVELEYLESPRVHTLSRDRRQAFLGTAWFLRAYDGQGELAWRTELTGEAQLLNATVDGRWVVASLSDGTVRWYRTTDGAEVLALFPHMNGQDWIAWIPDGYYMSSLYGDEFIGWHINNGPRARPDFYRAVQFERVLYRPDIVQAYFRSYGDPGAIRAILGPGSFSISQLNEIAPPMISADVRANAAPGVAELMVTARTDTLSMEEISIYINGIPINGGVARKLGDPDARAFERRYNLPLQAGQNRVRVEVANAKSLGVEEVWVEAAGGVAQESGDLYLLSIGVSNFDDPDVPPLRFAAKDAEDIADVFRETGAGPFDNVFVKDLVDGSGEEVRAALDFIQGAGARDTVVLFFASHGLNVGTDYYFAPSDARIAAPAAGLPSEDDLVLESFLKWEELFEPMRQAAGKRLMIVDTCASGNVSGPADLFSLQKRSASSKIAFMTASAGNQLSQELNRRRQGLFTFTVLTALRDRYDPDRDGLVSLAEVFDLSSQMVPAWREIKSLEQTPQLMAPPFLANMALGSAAAGRGATQ
jgi:WD40 repeat protein